MRERYELIVDDEGVQWIIDGLLLLTVDLGARATVARSAIDHDDYRRRQSSVRDLRAVLVGAVHKMRSTNEQEQPR